MSAEFRQFSVEFEKKLAKTSQVLKNNPIIIKPWTTKDLLST